MNYFKQGDVANADKIKAAFKAKGIDVLGFGFADKTVVYCSIGGVCVQTLPYSVNLMNILYSHPDYQELELNPDFKVGDWVVKKDGETFYGGNYAEQITLIDVDEKGKCIWFSSKTWTFEDDIRPWAIADARDGDVLATDNGWTCIFKAFDGCMFSSYCFMDSQNWVYAFGSEVHTSDSRINGNIHPATKEQRTLFFKKMQEAGYQWYAGKKELRKIIEPKFKVGNWYLCVKDVYYRYVRFDKGNAYYCGKDGCLQQFDSGAHISIVEELYEYFRPWTIADTKAGDVLAVESIDSYPFQFVAIYKERGLNFFNSYCCIGFDGKFYESESGHSTEKIHPATKEQHDLLFAKMKEAGYEWDAEKKELRKIKPHYDISNFKPFDKVLIRDSNGLKWTADLFSYIDDGFVCTGGIPCRHCIPFNDDTKHLLGTTDMCPEEYVNW